LNFQTGRPKSSSQTLESDLSYFDYSNYDSTIPLRIKVSRLGTLLIRWTLRSIPRRPHKSPAHTVKEPFRAGSTSGCPGAFHSREPRIIHPLESPSTPAARSPRTRRCAALCGTHHALGDRSGWTARSRVGRLPPVRPFDFRRCGHGERPPRSA